MIRRTFPWKDSDVLFHDQLLETWTKAMQTQYAAHPETDRVLAVHATYNLTRETISAAFQDSARERNASLMDLELTFQRILGWKMREGDVNRKPV
jgi:hypothetical protein